MHRPLSVCVCVCVCVCVHDLCVWKRKEKKSERLMRERGKVGRRSVRDSTDEKQRACWDMYVDASHRVTPALCEGRLPIYSPQLNTSILHTHTHTHTHTACKYNALSAAAPFFQITAVVLFSCLTKKQQQLMGHFQLLQNVTGLHNTALT